MNHTNSIQTTQTDIIKGEFKIIINDRKEMLGMKDFKKNITWK